MLQARGEAFQAVSVYIWPEEEGLSSPFQQCGKEATIPLIFRHVETEGKLNSQQLTQFLCASRRWRHPKQTLLPRHWLQGPWQAAVRLKSVLADSIFTGIQTLKRDKWLKKWVCSPCKMFQPFVLVSLGVSAGWPDTAAKAHRAISTLSLDASNLAYLSRYSKLMNIASFTQPIPAAFWHSVSTVQWGSHVQPWPSLHTRLHGFTQSTPTADTAILWLHKGLHSQDCLLIIICEPAIPTIALLWIIPSYSEKFAALSALSVSHHLLLMSWQLIETDMSIEIIFSILIIFL